MSKLRHKKASEGQGLVEYALVVVLAAVIFIATLSLLSSCYGGYDTDVIDATARDTIWGVEQTRGGAANVWLMHDDVASYCTNDEEVAEEALNILENHGGEVLITYRTIKVGMDTYDWWHSSDCGSLGGTAEGGGTVTFQLVSIKAVPARGVGR